MVKKKILVIDDEVHIVLMASTRLIANGYVVIAAASGAEGLEKAKKEIPDLILLDHVMPGMDGEEVLERLKKIPALKGVPVVMFTADVKKVRVGDYQVRGAEDCLFKPFTPEELLSMIRKVLRQEA